VGWCDRYRAQGSDDDGQTFLKVFHPVTLYSKYTMALTFDMYIYMYVCGCECVCMWLWVWVCVCVRACVCM
jgi:hypothetical protein